MAILQAVMQKLTGKPAPTNAAASTAAPMPNLKNRVNSLFPLFELQQKRQLLEVVCNRTGERFQSLILELDFDSNTLVLDDLFPTPQGGLYQPGELLTVKHHKDGTVLSFSMPLESVVIENHTPLFKLRMPEQVEYRQRRSQPRVALSKQQPLTVKLQSPRRTPWYATANNISSGGMRVVVGGNVLDQLQPGVLLPQCEFSFDDDFQVRCQARAKSFRFLRRPYRHTEISLEFIDVAPQQTLQLKQLVNSVQTPEAA